MRIKQLPVIQAVRAIVPQRGMRSLIDPHYRPLSSVFKSPFDDPFFQVPSILHSTLPSMFQESAWMRPALNVSDTPTHYKIKVELPGMNKEQVKISLKEDVLTIEGERKEEKVEDEENHYIKESAYGSFRRQIALPADANAEQIEASMDNGILLVQLAKKPEAQVSQAKSIPIE
jgi:HSP20 family protein